MPFCPKCGAQVEEGQKFCPKCGHSFDENAQPNPEAQAQAQSGSNFADGVNDFINDIQNTEDHSAGYSVNDIAANKGISVLSYFGLLVLIPMLARKDSPFARFHSNQGLVLFITEIIVGVVSSIIKGIFALIHVAFVGSAIAWLLDVCMFVLAIMGIVYAVQGKAKELPVIGKIKILK